MENGNDVLKAGIAEAKERYRLELEREEKERQEKMLKRREIDERKKRYEDRIKNSTLPELKIKPETMDELLRLSSAFKVSLEHIRRQGLYIIIKLYHDAERLGDRSKLNIK